MDIIVYIDNKASYKLPIKKSDTVATIKNYLKDYLQNIKFFLNSKEELSVFNTDKYDNLKLNDIWGKLLNPKIYVKTDSEK